MAAKRIRNTRFPFTKTITFFNFRLLPGNRILLRMENFELNKIVEILKIKKKF